MTFVRWLLRSLDEAEDRQPFRLKYMALAKDLQRAIGYSFGVAIAVTAPPSHEGRVALAILSAGTVALALAGLRKGGHRRQAHVTFVDGVVGPTIVLLATGSTAIAHATAVGIAVLALIITRIDLRLVAFFTTVGALGASLAGRMVAVTDPSRLVAGSYVILVGWFLITMTVVVIQWWQARRNLATREAELASLLGAAPVTLLTIDHHGTIASLAGRVPDERWEVGRPLLPLLPGDLSVAAAHALAGHTSTVDVTIGTRLLQMTCTPIPSGATLTGFDITDREQARRELEQLVATKDRFVASISHELRTPLTAVVGFAQELALSPELSDVDGEYVRFISDQGAEMAAIIEDLLVAARADLGLVSVLAEPVDLAVEVEAVATGLQARRARAIGMMLEPTKATADPVRLRQIVRNLITNADRYGGDKVDIRVGSDDQGPFVDVCDSGPPLSAEQQEMIFLPYVSSGREDSQPSAIGLGLSVSRTLAEMMDGSLEYLHDGESSIFRLRLPTTAGETPSDADHLARTSS